MPDPVTAEELDQLKREWTERLEESLARTSFTVEELTELAAQQRSFAEVTDSPGQRRAFLELAERYEQAAREQAAV